MFSMDFLVKEFLFDCRVRSLSEQTILNYKKQLGHFVRFLETECKVTNIEDLKPCTLSSSFCLRLLPYR